MGDSFGLNFRGKAQREPTEADHFQYSNPIYSLATGAQVGTATHHVFFTEKPMILDHTMTGVAEVAGVLLDHVHQHPPK